MTKKKEPKLYTLVYSYKHNENGRMVESFEIHEHMRLKYHNKKGRFVFESVK